MWSLPYANSDMISSVIGEELGGWFCIFLVGCYVTLTVAGFFIAIHAPDRFGKLLGFGLVCLIAMQAVIHLGVTTAMLPNKGMPLPFVSAGGTNMICLLCAVGILLNLHRQSARLAAKDPVLGRAKLTPAI
jgi:cell division protein FtsW